MKKLRSRVLNEKKGTELEGGQVGGSLLRLRTHT
jgi:hypothetical protein